MSPILKARVAGAWAERPAEAGYVRVGGAWVAYGGGGGPTYESITWPAGPTDTDENDGTQCYNMGRRFTLNADATVVGVEWRVPDTVATPNGTHAVALWDVTSSTRLAFKAITPTPGGYEQFLFDAGDYHAGLTTENLIASVYMNHYVFNTSEHTGSTSPSGTIVAGEMFLIPFNSGAATAPIPDSSTSLNFYVSPIIQVP